ncbi:MAG: hypothetical protein QOH61_325 [Chloroflexota bacterium]|jgi:hypothetical protein|nr:hypothetical protein [Chloroflexota bacterium]
MTTKGVATVGLAGEPAVTAELRAGDRPYAPSWVDVLTRWIDRLPGPTWVAYAAIAVFALLWTNLEGAMAGLDWFDPVQSSYAFYFVFPLALVHYLDRVAGRAWDRFRPATNLDDREAAHVRYRLTVTPARPAAVLLALGYAITLAEYAADPEGNGISGNPLAYVLLRAIAEGLIAAIVFVLAFHTFRQLRIVSQLHASAIRVNLFQPGALHAMSQLTGRSAIGIIILAVFIGVPYPGTSDQAWLTTTFVSALPLIGVALAAFIIPLRGLHDRLAAERSRLLDDVSGRLETALAALHRAIEREAANESDPGVSGTSNTRIDALSKAQQSLMQEREFIARLSTWPWDPGTLRAVVSAIALPVAIWLLTRGLSRFI